MADKQTIKMEGEENSLEVEGKPIVLTQFLQKIREENEGDPIALAKSMQKMRTKKATKKWEARERGKEWEKIWEKERNARLQLTPEQA